MDDDEPQVRITYGCQEIWQVEVVGGASEIDLSGPVRFGGPSMTLKSSPDDTCDVHHPLEYAPVALIGGGAGTWLSIATNNGDDPDSGRWVIHRQMYRVFDVEFTNLGTIEIEGLELRPDGVPVRALWHVDPYEPHVEGDEA